MIIGGAEDKLHKRTILKDFVAASGGQDARIAVIPTASSLGPEVVEVYDALFRKLGAKDVVAARPQTREDADDPDIVGKLDDGDGDVAASNEMAMGYPTSAVTVMEYDGAWADLGAGTARVQAFHVGRG